MELKQQLDSTISQWNLLTNPFYQAWSAGTLSTAALQTYAAEYGNFIALLPTAWQTLDDPETAQEETDHAEMWQQFTDSLQAQRDLPHLAESQQLVTTAQALFAEVPTAIGALYAFEVQQPETASSKLAGLRTHYQHLGASEAYFEVHTRNHHEAEKLLQRIYQLSEQDQQTTHAACETMSRSLWETLSAIGKATFTN